MHIHKQLSINAPVSDVWQCLTDPSLLTKWISSLVDETPVEPGIPGLGAKSTMRLREGKKIVAYDSVVTAWEPDRRVGIQFTGGSFGPGMTMEVMYTLTPTATGTDLGFDEQIPLKGMAKLMTPIIWLVSRGTANSDLAKLAELAPTIGASRT